MRTHIVLPCGAALVALSLAFGCEPEGTYRINWSFSDGEITSAVDCSSRGVERVVVTLLDPSTGAEVKRTVHPCRSATSGDHSVARGTYRVRVQAYGGSDQPFLDPVTGQEALVEYITELSVGGKSVAQDDVVFTPNPACADGVDNDSDGLVDAADPGCRDKNGDYDPTSNDEVSVDTHATLSVTWALPSGAACADLQPQGATTTSVLVDGLEVGVPDCATGSHAIDLAPGLHTVALQLVDASSTVLAETPVQDATLVEDLTTELDFLFSLDTFDPPQTGELSFHISWIAAGQTCTDASPIIAEQRLWLQDADSVTVDATTLAGTTVDNTAAAVGQCLDASALQGLSAYIPAGTYTLTVTGLSAGGAACWDATFPDLQVGIGPGAPLDLVVPQTDATGLCAP